MTPEISSFVDPLSAAKTLIEKKGVDHSNSATSFALIAIAEELQKLNDTLEYINGKLTVPPKEAKWPPILAA